MTEGDIDLEISDKSSALLSPCAPSHSALDRSSSADAIIMKLLAG
jgi:hypothetical protein